MPGSAQVEPSDYEGYLASLPTGPDSKQKAMYATRLFPCIAHPLTNR